MNEELYNLIERLANLLRHETRQAGLAMGLQPIQQEALYYLSTCNRYSDTLLAVTDYLGLTKGTVSQTLKVLETKGLVEKIKDTEDKRITHLTVTEAGRTFLNQTCPPRQFSEVACNLPVQTQSALQEALTEMLYQYQQRSGRNGFGVCRQCKYNQSSQGRFVCGLTKESLSEQDTRLICREFTQ
ncbi:MarR family winged helix-turn-helix transcriptional regulator [Pseudoalteromonas sp. OOF1S-7]|uniref:MarR family winged helix-turn-helix transcriptional regulator n=1 Tax=Pseudoalteromonas sp. OOF1S-7 TaxID=2917757 RepID=UPI001EF5DA51|nr:MarR family winged helix-turn-helix transcriptional regulator [Pseudoalteromonas sp. OOF1S-7]MCG7535161.1 MarR family winged helix-turn-helix transcriptional regulator [Pseudoalteromonas sp. OOF1S-7]